MPSPLTLLLIAIAAIFWHNGMNYAFSLASRRNDPLNGLFGIMCLLGGGYALASLAGYRAVDLSACLYAAKWQTTFARLILIVLPWFIGLYSDFRPKRFLVFLSVAFLTLGVANLLSANGLLFSEIFGLVHHETPWGEPLAALAGRVSPVTYFVYALDLVVIGFVAFCGWLLLRRGDRIRAWRLLALVGFAMVAFINDTLLDAGKIRSVYLEEYVVFAFLLVIGTWLGARRIRAESNYRTLFHAVSDAILVHDAQTGQLLDANESAARLYRTTRQDLLSGDPARASAGSSPHGPEDAVERIRRAAREGPSTFEWQSRHIDDGSPFWTEVALRSEVIDGRHVVLAVVRDIGKRKQFEARMQQMHKLESLGLLAGGVAHDFNNLLTAVLGNVELAAKDLPESSPARIQLGEIHTIASRAADLCRQLLAYSGRGGFVSKPIVLQDIVEETVLILEVSRPAKVRLVFSFADDVPLMEGDPTQIRQVMMNLITNAFEAIGNQEGVTTMALSRRQIDRNTLHDFVVSDEVAAGTYIELTVTDTGCGMDEATASRVFEPFFSTKFSGRGLGMAVVLGIVRGHRGAIRIASESGKGTTVSVLFPAGGPESIPSVEITGPVPRTSNTMVLVVDDNARVLKAVSQLVEALGYPVLTASSGQEALRVFGERQSEVGCVLLDLTMPDMDGLETMQGLRSVDPKVRIVLSSGYSEQSVRRRVTGKGPTRFLQKPFVEDDLKAAIESVMRVGDREAP
jgi:PAS domain S-box-containing protein